MWGSLWGTLWAGGASSSETFTLASVRAVGARVVRVTFTSEPLYSSPIGRYDAGNLERWQITREDTGRSIPLLGTRAVADDPLSIELLLAEPFRQSSLLVYDVVSNDIRSVAGEPLSSPTRLTLFGMPALVQLVQAARPLLDLRNPQVNGQSFNGSLSVGTSGDYDHESGASLLKKLIYRRVLTAVGEFYHLADTNYGAGLQPKQLFRVGDLVVLRTQLELQIAAESDIAAAAVSLGLGADGRLDVGVKARTKKTGQQIDVSFPLNSSGGSQVI